MTAPTVVWFRQDLRLADNPALDAAIARGAPLVAVYVLDDDTPGDWKAGGASRWWLHHSLASLAKNLDDLGQRLVLRRGAADEIIKALVEEVGAGAVFWNRCYEPSAIARDTKLKSGLGERDVEVASFNGSLLVEPWTVKTKSGDPFKVFTPFWRAVQEGDPMDAPSDRPEKLPAAPDGVDSDDLDDWELLPTKPDWAGGMRDAWTPGEAGARDRLARFLDDAIADYAAARDRPDSETTSRLSPHLHFGEISPRQVWQALDDADRAPKGTAKFRSELGWREFSYHLLHQFPKLPEENFRPEFDAFPWQPDEAHLRAWQRGRTGVPIVDAGMRELWGIGWMHNRVRMVVASFLVKHLLQPWQDGARWFWDTLVDADLANNSASWQWVAGCGADAAPYFRVFNPVLQGEKFDPKGDYVRCWVPELADVPDKYVHKPWEMGSPPKDYPAPLVDIGEGRRRALAAYDEVKGGD